MILFADRLPVSSVCTESFLSELTLVRVMPEGVASTNTSPDVVEILVAEVISYVFSFSYETAKRAAEFYLSTGSGELDAAFALENDRHPLGQTHGDDLFFPI